MTKTDLETTNKIFNLNREVKPGESADALNLAAFMEPSYSEKKGTTPDPLDVSVAEAQNAEQMSINEEAQRVWESGNALEYLVDTCQKLHVGNIHAQTGLILAFADTRVIGSKGLHVFLMGKTGSGKSHLADAVGKILPQDHILTANFSDKALFRYDEWKDETMVFIDEQTMSEPFSETYKQVSSDWNKPAPYLVSEKVNGAWKAVMRYTKTRCPFVHLKANYTGDEQTADRQLKFDITCDIEQLQAIRKYQIEHAIHPSLKEELYSVRIARAIWDFIKHSKVSIPFSIDIICKKLEEPRVFNQMLELIQASAVMAAPCRNRNELGELEASIDDFMIACKILNSEEGAQRDELGSEAKELLLYLEKLPTSDYFFKEIRDKAKISQTRLNYALHGRDKVNKDLGGLCSLPGGSVGTRSEGREGILEWNKERYDEFNGSSLSLFSMDRDRILYWQMTENRKKSC